ncbi:hypothetical protein, partial [Brevundimonas sp.]|uniref:hypothetical protein n=1 Tax=Brevundimonas sp. TaxID=1871086 RepID=UPI0025C25724
RRDLRRIGGFQGQARRLGRDDPSALERLGLRLRHCECSSEIPITLRYRFVMPGFAVRRPDGEDRDDAERPLRYSVRFDHRVVQVSKIAPFLPRCTQGFPQVPTLEMTAFGINSRFKAKKDAKIEIF